MDTISLILSIITTLFSSLNLIIGLFYLIPIIILPRFHHRNHFLTLNVCIANILCCIVWFPDDPLFRNDSTTKMRNIQTIFTLQVPFSFVIVSIHRYCSVVYRKKTFFKTRRWICLCVGIQWILGILLSIPDLLNFHTANDALWKRYHLFIFIVVIPSIIFFITNTLVYFHVRSSSRRIQPQTIVTRRHSIRLSHRDTFLLRHILFMLVIFIGGWTPLYLLPIIDYYRPVNTLLDWSLTAWCEIALLINVIDLFLYNHDLRKFIRDICFWCCRQT